MATDTSLHVDAILPVLRRSDLCRGLTPAELQFVAESMRPISLESGQVICRQDEAGDRMWVVARGRVQLTVDREDGQFGLIEYMGQGDHLGEMSLLTDLPRSATATAVMHCELLELDEAGFQRLMSSVPSFAANLSRSLGYRLRWQTIGRAKRRQPKVVALICQDPHCRKLAPLLARNLCDRAESVEVLTNREETWNAAYSVERLSDAASPEHLIKERLHQGVIQHDRVLLDLCGENACGVSPEILAQCEEILWIADEQHANANKLALRRFTQAHEDLASRIHLVWVLRDVKQPAPVSPRELGIAPEDFKITLPKEGDPEHCRGFRQGLSRLVRHLKGVKVGIALGGGGARGMAHLGVLRAMDQAGIYFDALVGTSSGALMGVSYAAGWSPDDALDEFTETLTPQWFFRAMPGGSYWYLWAMYRSGAWDRKLRPRLGRATIEQMRVPFYTVAVDLISGKQIVRDSGDVVHAVLETINLPPISLPILRDGMALVDGGLLNNVPADVLPAMGVDLVVAVDVVSKLPKSFYGNNAQTPPDEVRQPSTIATLLRANEVQDYGLAALRREGVDLLITPDTSAFDFADFTKGHALADAGEAAALEQISQLKQMVAELETNG